MTAPTRAIAPLLLEDYRKITVDRYGETDFFTTQQIKQCIKKVRRGSILKPNSAIPRNLGKLSYD